MSKIVPMTMALAAVLAFSAPAEAAASRNTIPVHEACQAFLAVAPSTPVLAGDVQACIKHLILLAAGTDRTVIINTGSGSGGPAGAKGDTGATGAQGSTGATGAAGAKGDKGDTGATGAKGDTGAQGPKGDQGEKGDTGPKGDKGDKGDRGGVCLLC